MTTICVDGWRRRTKLSCSAWSLIFSFFLSFRPTQQKHIFPFFVCLSHWFGWLIGTEAYWNSHAYCQNDDEFNWTKALVVSGIFLLRGIHNKRVFEFFFLTSIKRWWCQHWLCSWCGSTWNDKMRRTTLPELFSNNLDWWYLSFFADKVALERLTLDFALIAFSTRRIRVNLRRYIQLFRSHSLQHRARAYTRISHPAHTPHTTHPFMYFTPAR